jgi:branched-chain amino acid transport system permease protein
MRRGARWALIAAAAAAGCALPWMGVSNSLLFLTTMVLIYAIVGQGTNFLFATAGILSVAQGALWGVGAYIAAIGLHRAGLGFWPAVALSLPIAALVAVLAGYPARRVQGHYFAIVTFAFAEMFVIFGNNAISLTGGNQGLIVSGPVLPKSLPLTDLQAIYLVTLLFFALSLVAATLLKRSNLGMRLAAARVNAPLATSLGINVHRDRLMAFAVSGAAAGVGGVLYAYATRYAQPSSFDVWAGITFLTTVMIGGRGYVLGPTAGAAVALYVPHLLSLDPNVNQILHGILLIAVMLLLPKGILGTTAIALRNFRSRASDAARYGASPR